MILMIKLLGCCEGEADEWIEFGQVSPPLAGSVVVELDDIQMQDVLHVPMIQLECWRSASFPETRIEYQPAHFRLALGDWVRV